MIGTSNKTNELETITANTYTRPSYLDERKQYESNYLRHVCYFLEKLIFKSYVDRRKSLQESPPRTLDDRGISPFTGHYSGYTGAYGNNGHYGLNYGGYGVSNASRYEDEIYNAFYPTSSSTANNAQVLKKNLI